LLRGTSFAEVTKRMRAGAIDEQGFTLIELLVVVAIIALLAVVATTTYSRYASRAKGAQAMAMLSEIAGREEAYFATYGVYLDTGGFHPGLGSQGAEPRAKTWNPGAPAVWSQLGVKDPGQTYFQFRVVAGAPGTAAPGGIFGVSANNLDTTVAWFVGHAQGDLRGNGTRQNYVITSGRPQVISDQD
jgi:prepilin-type N-terminal cleavage/methylation domain-containing protein